MRRDQGSYLRDPAAIYRESFAAIRREAPLEGLPEDLRPVALRLIHACGMPDIVADLAWTADAVGAGRAALRAGAPILVDATMVRGRHPTRARGANPILCTLEDEATQQRAAACATTRSAAAVDGWCSRLEGAVVAIGNAPTALFRLLELLADGRAAPGPGAGFSGRLHRRRRGQGCADRAIGRRSPHITLRGRRGGSAMAAAALNALLADDPLA